MTASCSVEKVNLALAILEFVHTKGEFCELGLDEMQLLVEMNVDNVVGFIVVQTLEVQVLNVQVVGFGVGGNDAVGGDRISLGGSLLFANMEGLKDFGARVNILDLSIFSKT